MHFFVGNKLLFNIYHPPVCCDWRIETIVIQY
jgi:hypothetical protein